MNKLLNNCLSIRKFVQIRTKFTKSDLHVVLLKDVPELGTTGEIILAKRGFARNFLVPNKLAYYIPRFKGKPILPDNWTAPVVIDKSWIEVITPAIVTVPYDDKLANMSVRRIYTGPSSTSTQTLESLPESELRNALAKLGALTFERVPIDSDSTNIFGSVTNADVSNLLQDQFKLIVPKEAIVMDKVKTLGIHPIQIQFSIDLEPIKLDIEVIEQPDDDEI
ncbi:hypothetical protein BC833DRAFT_598884 [Globomyces pollinis-pini]|nr:hypothetical protein BC833DRAFT_598884 [Globomyces pollinis-pini]